MFAVAKHTNMKKVYTIIAAALMFSAANATTYTVGSGKWTDASAWNGQYPGTTIKADDVVIINGQMTVNAPITVEGSLTVEKGASMIGMKDLVIAKSGKFVNNGNTVMKRIYNEGSINNNMIMEAMMDIENKGGISNNNNMVAGNNLQNYGGNAAGNGGAYFVNNTVVASPSAKFGSDVKVMYGNAIENSSATNTSAMNLNTDIKENSVVLSVAAKNDVKMFSIEKSNDGKNFQVVEMVTVNNGAMTYTDSKVNTNLTYYRVTAINANGEEVKLPVAAVKVPFSNALSYAN